VTLNKNNYYRIKGISAATSYLDKIIYKKSSISVPAVIALAGFFFFALFLILFR